MGEEGPWQDPLLRTLGRIVNGQTERIEGDGWKEALEQYKTVADDLHAGRTPRVKTDGLTVVDLCNRFLTAKLRKQEAGELGRRMITEYKEITDVIVAAFGRTRLVEDLAADDFEALRANIARRWGPIRLGSAITSVKSVFKYGTDNGLIEKTSAMARSSGSRTRLFSADTGRRLARRCWKRRNSANCSARRTCGCGR